jgi:hypothetical protein
MIHLLLLQCDQIQEASDYVFASVLHSNSSAVKDHKVEQWEVLYTSYLATSRIAKSKRRKTRQVVLFGIKIDTLGKSRQGVLFGIKIDSLGGNFDALLSLVGDVLYS